MRIVAVEEHYRAAAYRRAVEAAGGSDPGPIIGPLLAQLDDVGEGRLAEMDAAGIDVQVLSHNAAGPEDTDADAVQLVAAMNDELHSAVLRHPSRFAAFASLPVTSPERAAAELRRCVEGLGFVGGIVNGTSGGLFLDHRQFRPIFAEAETLGVPIYLHPSPPPPAVDQAYYSGFDEQVSFALARGAWGWHVEAGLHALRLVLSGLFDEHPRLQILLGHMGEALPFMLSRTESVLARFSKLERPLGQYFVDNFHYTTSGFFSDAPFRSLVDMVGFERVLFAVDYPFSKNAAGRRFLDQLPVTGDERELIAHRNADRLLRLTTAR